MPAIFAVFAFPAKYTALPLLMIFPSVRTVNVPRSKMCGGFNQVSFQVIHRLFPVFLVDLVHAGHNRPPDCNVKLVFVSAFVAYHVFDRVPGLVVNDTRSGVCKLFNGAFYRLTITDRPGLDLHFCAVQRPLIGFGWWKHRPAIINQKTHGLGEIRKRVLCLLIDGPGILDIHEALRGSYVGYADQLRIIRLVSLNHIIKQLIQLFLADSSGFPNGLFDVFQVNAMRP